jgi:PAS domain S-box-containing protein
VLYWYNKDFPGNVAFDRSFQVVLQSEPAGTVEYYSEYLESNRFPGENQALVLRDYLRRKYARRNIDAVVAVGDPPLDFLLKHRDNLFSRSPIIFVAAEKPAAKELAGEPGITGFLNLNAYKETLDLALRLHPGAEHVFVVSGTIERDRKHEMLAREELQAYESLVSITYLTDLTPTELVSKTSSLPERSIVLYVWQQAYDEWGKLLESRDVLALIADSTPAPIYGLSGWQIGRGIVGGYVLTLQDKGNKAAELALQVAKGARAQDIPVEPAPIVPMFDWGELKRWGISEKSLPPGSVVHFRVLSVWNDYKWYGMALIFVVIAQAVLIGGLIINRTRRKRAEGALRESEERFRNMADKAPVMIWVADADKHWTYVNQQWLDFTGRTMEEERGNGWADGVHPDDYEGCIQTYASAFDRREPFTIEYRLRRADRQYRWVIDSGTARFSPGGEFLGYIGSCIDITERKAAEQALMDLSGQLIHAREDECARIARELHDNLNQSVAIISLELDQLGQNPPQSQAKLRESVQKLMRQAADLAKEIHHLSHDLHPSKLAYLGLVAAVESLCAELSESYKLKIEFTHSGVPALLPKAISICLYRIVQESLNNVIKHSGAKEAQVELSGNGQEIRVRVSDSGSGFDLESARSKKGLGLISMRERLRLVGGTISINSLRSHGTQVCAKVPLRQMELEQQQAKRAARG